MGRLIVEANASGEVVHCSQGLSFWGGVDPKTGTVIDVHHPLHGCSLAGKIVLMPTSRGSCSGSGVLLQLALTGNAPAALVFSHAEEILTLGAIVAARLFSASIAVVQVSRADFEELAGATEATISDNVLAATGFRRILQPVSSSDLHLSSADLACLAGDPNDPETLAMEVLCTMASAQGAHKLIDVARGHVDGCIYAHDANLIFAERMADMGAQVRIPTTINAISVDLDHWQDQGVPGPFGNPASRLARAYVTMGVQPTFTCAPYYLEDAPGLGERIGWSESNAVIYANSVLGAQTAKLPDYLDLFVAMTGRAPENGVYLAQERRPACLIDCEIPPGHDDSLWPLIGWLAGSLAPDRIPLLRGLDHVHPDQDDLRAVCAAFGTTSAAPMLHVAGVTPEAGLPLVSGAAHHRIERADLAEAWLRFNTGLEKVDLVAIGSPHASGEEVRRFCELMDDRECHPETDAIVTLGREVLDEARAQGWISRLDACGVRVIPDLCWCSITEPVFPSHARTLMTNSGKYAHYAPGLSGRAVRFGSLAACADAAVNGSAQLGLPRWLRAP